MDPYDWDYVGEGNQNLVVRYVGTNPTFQGKVLRVIKGSDHLSLNSSFFKQQFIEKVIKPLLGEAYVPELSPLPTSSSFLQQLANHVEKQRPESRLHGKIAVNASVSFLMTDLTLLWSTLPTLTFELKPKWGFKPHQTNFPIKRQYCRFCMHSHQRQILLHGYCPLDLYSQDPKRVNKALSILLKRHPLEKNLRVSINGERISLVDQQPNKIYTSLLSQFTTQNDSTQENIIQDILAEILIKDPILPQLKALQESLDEVDIENIYPLYESMMDTTDFDITNVDMWDTVVKEFLHRQQKKTSTNVSIKQRIFEYVLSMTFKDCSIMINVAPLQGSSLDKRITIGENAHFQYDIKVIDTDLKSIKKIPYWYELDQSIVKYAMDTHFSKANC